MNENNLTAQQISENINNTISTITDEKIKAIKTNQQILAKVVLQDPKNENRYQVTTDAVKFYAYYDGDKELKKNTKVSVLIPEGDWTREDKIIIGVITKDSEEERKTLNTFDDLIPAYAKNILNDENLNLFYNPNYKYLGIKIGLNSNNTIVTDFKIKLKITIETPSGELEDYSEFIAFTNKDILGNSKILNPNIPQYKLFEYPKGLDPRQIKTVTWTIGAQDDSISNIIIPEITELIFYLGYSKKENSNSFLKLYAQDGTTPTYIGEQEKVVYVEYYDNKIGLQSHYDYSADVNEIPNIQLFEYLVGYDAQSDIEKEVGIYWKNTALQVFPNAYSYPIITKPKASKSRYKLILETTDEENKIAYKQSEELVFKNINLNQVEVSNENEPIYLQLEPENTGVYNYYNIDGSISDTAKSGIKHKITASFRGLENETLEVGKDGVISINWLFPTSQSGIVIPYWKLTEETIINENDEEETKITWSSTYLEKDAFKLNNIPLYINQNRETGAYTNIFEYYLNTKCFNSYNNNKIICEVTMEDNSVLRGSFNFVFGGAETSGSPYSLNIDFAEAGKTCVIPGEKVKLLATFTRIDGESIDVLPEYNWSWYERPVGISYAEYFYKNEDNEEIELISYNGSLLQPAQDDMGNIYTSNEIYVQIPELNTSDFTVTNYKGFWYAVAAVTVSYKIDNGETISLTDYLPLPLYFGNSDNCRLQGPDRIVYDMKNEIYYDKSNYILYEDERESTLTKWCLSSQEKIIQPRFLYTDGTVSKHFQNGKILNNYTFVEVTRDDDDTLNKNEIDVLPGSSHSLQFSTGQQKITTNLLPAENILVNKNSTNIISIMAYGIDGNILFVQPIITLNNAWNFAAINNWTGQSTSSEPDAILTPFFAAGQKNTTGNTFTGVMLGQSDCYGLFGYQQGRLRFYFNEKGAAYIGNSDSSDPYYIKLNEQGEFNLKLNNFTLDTPGLKLNSDPYFSSQIGNALQIYSNNKIRLNIGQLIETVNNGKPTSLDIDYGIQIYNNNGNKVFYFNSDDNTLVIDTDEGNIAGWAITKEGIAKTSNGKTVELNSNVNKSAFVVKESGTERFSVAWDGEVYSNAGFKTDNVIIFGNVARMGYWTGAGSEGFAIIGGPSSWFPGTQTPSTGYISMGYNTTQSKYYTILNTSQGDMYGTWRCLGNFSTPGGAVGDSGSDSRIKNSIEPFSEQYEILFDNLEGVRYIYNYGTSHRYHTGFEAQKVVEAIEKAGLTTQEFAAVMLIDNYDKELFGELKQIWHLRKDEFVALNTWQIQKTKKRVITLEEEVTELKQEIKELKEKYEIN